MDSKCLESFLIPEEITTEGLFSKMKEKREAKKAEREAALEAKRKAWPIIKRKVITECKAICNRYKSKNPKLPWKLKFVEEDEYVYIEVFTDEKYINPYYADGNEGPDYNKTAHDVYENIFKEIEQKYTNQEIDGIKFIVDSEEWNEIDIYLD